MRSYQISFRGNADGSFTVEYFNPYPDEGTGDSMITTFLVWGLNVIRATPALMRAAGFEEAP